MGEPHRIFKATILGQPVGKSGGWKVVRIGGHCAMALTPKGKSYKTGVRCQVPKLNPMLEGRLTFCAILYYGSERPDLDPALLLDALQGRVYANDRQVREMHLVHGIDKKNPRAEVRVWEL